MKNKIKARLEGDIMAAYMKQTLKYNGKTQHQRYSGLVGMIRSIGRDRLHSELDDVTSGTLSMELPYEVQEKIRLFRQKHFKD